MMILLMKLLLMYLFILLSVAFYTFLERKILSYVNFRFGPNKVSYLGLFQSISDALKLFGSEDYSLSYLNFFFYFFIPLFGMFLMLVFWVIYPFWGSLLFSNFSFLIFYCFSSAGVYFLLLSGWSSGSKYSMFGGYRSSAQSISYEILLVLCFLTLCIFMMSLNILNFNVFQISGMFFLLFGGCFFCWLVSSLAECNRSPFDFSEGESELVSGFNTEYGGGLFSLIFIGEYSSILFFSFLTGLLFFSGFGCLFFSVFFYYFYLWVRASFPRLRYDKLMLMAWSGLLFFIIGPLIFSFLVF